MNSFEVFGKVMAVLAVITVLVIGGFILGQKGTFKAAPSPTPTPVDSLTTPAPIGSPILEQEGTQGSTPKVAQVAAGSAQFGYYAMAYFSDWTPKHESGGGVDRLTLSKEGYQLAITQGAGNHGACMYPKQQPQDPATSPPAGSQQFANATAFNGEGHSYARGSREEDATSFTICQETQGGYVFPTSFGYINYTTPLDPDAQVLGLMDRMIGSIVPYQPQQKKQ